MILIITAVFLIALGVIIIILSMDVKKVENCNNRNYSKDEIDLEVKTKDHPLKEDIAIITSETIKNNSYFEDEVVEEKYDEAVEKSTNLKVFSDNEIVDEKEKNENSVKSDNVSVNNVFNIPSVLMYEDRDNVVTFAEDKGMLLPEKFDSLTRIGKGDLEVSKNSMNFRVEKKTFRYEFYRIKSISGNDEFMIMELNEKNIPYVFIIDNKESIYKIVEIFNNYKR